MGAVRILMLLARVLGVLALVLIVYAWCYPARMSAWIAPPEAAPKSVRPVVAVAPAPAAPLPEPPAKPAPREPLGSRSQTAVADWLGARYHVAPEAIEPLVIEADKLSPAFHLSPNLVIAVMAIESNFHPYIQSEAGAQGLMQVMPKIHARRYEKFGGKSSFVDPMVSLKVGAEILRDCVKLKGSETEALRFYLGGGPAGDAYIEKVRAEQHRLNLVASGAHVPVESSINLPVRP